MWSVGFLGAGGIVLAGLSGIGQGCKGHLNCFGLGLSELRGEVW